MMQNAEAVLAVTEVSWAVTALFGLLLVGLIACLALEEKIHAKKSIIAGVFAIVCLALGAATGVLPFQKVLVGSNEMVEHGEVDGQIVDDDHSVHVHVDSTETETGDEKAGHGENGHAQPVSIGGHRIGMPVYIPGIDWGVIAIILGSSLFVDVTSKSGLFTWIAIRVTKASAGDPLKLLCFYGVMTVLFSAVLNNVTAMIIVGSLTVVSLEKLQQRDKLFGFLMVEGLLTNIGGLLTLISSVPNIIVGGAANISFLTFFLKASPYVTVATVITLALGARMFQVKRLATAKDKEEAKNLVSSFDENDGIESNGFFWFATVMLVLFVLAIAAASVLPMNLNKLGMGFVALSFAGVMLVRYKAVVDDFYRNIDWDLLGFFMALFVVIYVMEHALVLATIGSGVNAVLADVKSSPATVQDSAVLLVGAAVFSSVTDNIPLAAMLANILSSLGVESSSGLWWSIIFGANLGGNLTPIGSASTLVAVTIMHKHKLAISFAGFVKAAIIFAITQILLAVVYVVIFLR